jgi:hypothetical protein
MEPEDICGLRSGVDINITLLAALTGRLTRDNTVKLVRYQENKEQQAILDWLTPTGYAPEPNDFHNSCVDNLYVLPKEFEVYERNCYDFLKNQNTAFATKPVTYIFASSRFGKHTYQYKLIDTIPA